MKNWIPSLLAAFRVASPKNSAKRDSHKRCRLSPEVLEDRNVPSTFSSIASNFNGNAIPAGDSVWFNSAFKASGLGAGPVSIHVTDQTINFNAAGTAYSVSVPDSILNFSPVNTVATTSFDAANNEWITNLPMNWSGNAFMGGATFAAATGLPGGINPVTWSGNFATDTAGVSMNWQFGAAVYTSFSSDYNTLNVKPLDSNSATIYHNSDHAGTPEAFKSFVIGGARGGGGSNWTGSYSATGRVAPEVENFEQHPATISGVAVDKNGAPLAGVMISLRDSTGTIVQQATTDGTGYYQITVTDPNGAYSLSASKGGFNTITATAGTDNDGIPGDEGTSHSNPNGGAQITNIGLSSGDVAINYNFVLTPGNI